MDEVIADMLRFNKECCQTYKANSQNAVDEIFKALDMLQVIFDNMNPSILHDIERNYPATYKKFKDYKYKFLYELVKQNMVRGINEELYRPEINIEVLAKVRLETMMLPFDEQLFPKNKFSMVISSSAANRIFLIWSSQPQRL